MKNYILFVVILLVSCSNQNTDISNVNFNFIEIEFDGLKKEFYQKGNILLNFQDKEVMSNFNTLKKSLKRAPLFPSIKPVLFQIDLRYKNSNTEDELLITVNSDLKDNIVFMIGNDYYISNDFFDYISKLLKIQDIRNYKGSLNQEGYNEFIR